MNNIHLVCGAILPLPQYVFMAWCWVKHMVCLTLLYVINICLQHSFTDSVTCFAIKNRHIIRKLHTCWRPIRSQRFIATRPVLTVNRVPQDYDDVHGRIGLNGAK